MSVPGSFDSNLLISRPRSFFGEPPALGFLSFTEAWERFSYYGMTALMVLYMSQQLLLAGHVEHVAFFAGFRALLEQVFGPMSNLALASQILGLYTGARSCPRTLRCRCAARASC